MPRDFQFYIQDILDSIDKIERYLDDLTYLEFIQDEKTMDAVLRNLEIIGEAARNIPQNVRQDYKQISWKKIVGLRNILIHEYFGIDNEILWDIIQNKLPELKNNLEGILE